MSGRGRNDDISSLKPARLHGHSGLARNGCVARQNACIHGRQIAFIGLDGQIRLIVRFNFQLLARCIEGFSFNRHIARISNACLRSHAVDHAADARKHVGRAFGFAKRMHGRDACHGRMGQADLEARAVADFGNRAAAAHPGHIEAEGIGRHLGLVLS